MAEQELKAYHGNCHCGAFKFSVKLPELKQVHACNCSICTKKGYLWLFPPSDDLFVVEKGEGTLKDYVWGKETLTHKVPDTHFEPVHQSNANATKFCPTCGTPVLGQRHTESHAIGVNVRTFQDFDESKLELKLFDGASLEPQRTPPNGAEVTDLNDSTKCYRGSCHCGKVTFDLHSKPLEDIDVTVCDCSICSRHAILWVYPTQENVKLRGGEHLTVYEFGTKRAKHSFCSTCGVQIANRYEYVEGTGDDFMKGILPINVRAIDGIDLKGLKFDKVDGKGMGAKYEV